MKRSAPEDDLLDSKSIRTKKIKLDSITDQLEDFVRSDLSAEVSKMEKIVYSILKQNREHKAEIKKLTESLAQKESW